MIAIDTFNMETILKELYMKKIAALLAAVALSSTVMAVSMLSDLLLLPMQHVQKDWSSNYG